ncbi:MAG: pyrimidine 5'-nucleotidase, partial [Pseudomonadota bacterium]
MSPSYALAHVTDWVFDLDNTLYPGACDLFAQIDQRMTQFVAQSLDLTPTDARALQKRYYAEHGTTLNGLMTRHNMTPDAFLDYVHDIDLAPLAQAPDLSAAIDALPGRKFVFTNGSMGHAERVTKELGIDHLFTDMVDIVAADFKPKPDKHAFDRFL